MRKASFNELVEWVDAEGGPESLFMDHGVELEGFELTPYQRSQIKSMIRHYSDANNIWRNLEADANV